MAGVGYRECRRVCMIRGWRGGWRGGRGKGSVGAEMDMDDEEGKALNSRARVK